MKIREALYEAHAQCAAGMMRGTRVAADVLREFVEAPFPCGYAESVVHDAVAGVRPVLIESAMGMLTTDEARGIVADLIRSIDEAESR